jgi:hypothetical protein
MPTEKDYEEVHIEMHRASDELGKYSMHLNVNFSKNKKQDVLDFIEDLLISIGKSCLENGADMIGHIKAFMIAENASTLGASLVHQKMKVHISSGLKGEVFDKAELVVHTIVHGIWDPKVKEAATKALNETVVRNGVTYSIIRDYIDAEKSIAHHLVDGEDDHDHDHDDLDEDL